MADLYEKRTQNGHGAYFYCTLTTMELMLRCAASKLDKSEKQKLQFAIEMVDGEKFHDLVVRINAKEDNETWMFAKLKSASSMTADIPAEHFWSTVDNGFSIAMYYYSAMLTLKKGYVVRNFILNTNCQLSDELSPYFEREKTTNRAYTLSLANTRTGALKFKECLNAAQHQV